MAKKRVVHYLNQFFGQIGGEEAANVGFSLKEGPVGPGMALSKFLGDDYEIVATLICGDDFFSIDPEGNAAKGLEMIKDYQPDIFFAGPSFAAGRYTVACGAMCKAVGDAFGVPVISAMSPDAPGNDMYKKSVYIVRTGISSREMVPVVKKMAALGVELCATDHESKLLTREYFPDPATFDYYPMDRLRNEMVDELVATRSVEKLLAKIKGEPFESEVIPEQFEDFPAPKPIKDMKHAKIAFVTDGGLVPKGNPDKMRTRSNLVWNAYELDKLFGGDYEVVHAGYFNDYVLQEPDRLIPYNTLKDCVKDGEVGSIHPLLYSMPACTTVSKRGAEVGQEMAEMMKKFGDIDGVILTST